MKSFAILSYLIMLLLLVPDTYGQVVQPSLSLGTGEVLGFNKGVIDTDLLGEIISEKQQEIKKELAKRLLLNKKLSAGPYTTYNYASQVLETLLDQQDKNIIKKQLLEHSAELALTLGIAESYLRIDKKLRGRLIKQYIDLLKDNNVEMYAGQQSNDKLQDKNLINESAIQQHEGRFLSKVSLLYELKHLGRYRNGNLSTRLPYIILDMVTEVCRNNAGLQQLGFFQKKFDETAFLKRSHYNQFLEKVGSGSTIHKTLDTVKNRLDKIISLNLKYTSVILNQPSSKPITAKLEVLADSVFNNLLTNDLSKLNLKPEEKKVISRLSELAMFGKQQIQAKEDKRQMDTWVLAIESILPDLIALNTYSDQKFKVVVEKLGRLKQRIVQDQFGEANLAIAGLNNEFKSINLIQYNELDVGQIYDQMAAVFNAISKLDKASSYDQVAKLIVDVGNIFWDLNKGRIMSNISNLQDYIIVNQDSNRVDIKVEQLILFLGDKYINRSSGVVSGYFTLGFNYLFSGDSDFDQISLASEKVGVKLKLFDFYKYRTYRTRYLIPRQKPIINDVYLLAYGSGLLYQIEQLKTEKDLKGAIFGIATGTHFFNGLDLAIGAASVEIGDERNWVFTSSFDIPITEYLSRLGKKNKKSDSSD